MDKEGQFAGISGRIKSKRRPATVKIGHACREYVQKVKKGKGGAIIAEAFNDLLPQGLAEGCRIESVSRGVITVRVLPGVYMFQMKNASSALLKEIKKQCPRPVISEIKLVAER